MWYVNITFYYMASSASGQEDPNLALWLAPRAGNLPESHIINPILTKFVRSKWLDVGLVFFANLRTSTSVSVENTQKKNLANVQLSWPHTWLITYTCCQCFYWVIETLVTVCNNSKKLWERSPTACVFTAFLVLPNFHSLVSIAR